MDIVIYAMWTSFLLGFVAALWRLGAIVRDVLREPLPAHLGGTGHVRTTGGTRRTGDRNQPVTEPDPAWLHVPSLSERARTLHPEPHRRSQPTPTSESRHASVSRPACSPRWSELLAETLREAEAVRGH